MVYELYEELCLAGEEEERGRKEEEEEEADGKSVKKLARQEVGAHCQRGYVKWSLNSLW